MHVHTLEKWRHNHDFSLIHTKGEKRIRQVLLLTGITMVAEIVAGNLWGSMALLADGWHMGTHVAAFAISIFAYRYARKHTSDPKFSFGTGKVAVLGGFASAVALAVVALLMALESINRLVDPRPIHFNEAIIIAVIGLGVNLASAFLLQEHHGHNHDHDHGAGEEEHHHDHNLRAAYFHVLADALTSVLAIIALLAGKYFGWLWLDAVMGLVGALVITRWSMGLVQDTSPILLDQSMDAEQVAAIKAAIEADADNRICDLHIWRVGPSHYAADISLVTHFPKSSEHYKRLLAEFSDLAHVTIEVNHCDSEACLRNDFNTGQF